MEHLNLMRPDLIYTYFDTGKVVKTRKKMIKLMQNPIDIVINVTRLYQKWCTDHHQVYDNRAQMVLDHYKLVNNCSYTKLATKDGSLCFYNPQHPDRKYFVYVEQLIHNGVYRLTCTNPTGEPYVGPEIATYEEDNLRFLLIAVLVMVYGINEKYDKK